MNELILCQIDEYRKEGFVKVSDRYLKTLIVEYLNNKDENFIVTRTANNMYMILSI